jgi:hypothetical protein
MINKKGKEKGEDCINNTIVVQRTNNMKKLGGYYRY